MNVLCLQGLGKRYGEFVALHPFDLNVQAGERLAVMGPNGAGKSTLLRLIGGQITPSEGQVVLAGANVSRMPAEKRACLGLGMGFQRSSGFADLSVEENLLCASLASQSSPYSLWRSMNSVVARHSPLREHHENLLNLLGLTTQRHQRVGTLAYGEQRFLEVAMALAGSPQLLVLDEPCAGLNPHETQRMLAVLRSLPSTCALLLVEHDLEVVFALAQRIAVLDQGRLLACDSPHAIAENPQVQAAYGLQGRLLPLKPQEPAPVHSKVTPAVNEEPSSWARGLSEEGLRLQGVCAGYGGEPVLRDLNLHLAPGQTWALLGRNGSGRSTLAKVLAGHLTYQGEMTWQGQSLEKQAAHLRARTGLAYVPETRDVFASLSVHDNLGLGLPPAPWDRPNTPWSLEAVYTCFPQLAARRHTLAGVLSGGEQQMLSLARSLLANPCLLVVDEPTEGLAPQVVQAVLQCLQHVKASGCALLLIEQKMELALALADQVAILGQGRVQWSGFPVQLGEAPVQAVVRQWLAPQAAVQSFS